MEATFFHGSLPFIMDSPAVSRGGRGMLDSFRATLLCSANWEADARTLGFEIDKKLSTFPSLWVKSLEPSAESDDVIAVNVSGEGLGTAGDRRQRKMKCGERETSVGPNEQLVIFWTKNETGVDAETGEKLLYIKHKEIKIDDDGKPVYKPISTPSGNMNMWVVTEAEVSLMDTYFTTTKPVMSVAGQPFAPPNPPDVPPYQWGGYTENMHGNHPNGWILADRDVEEIFYFSDSIGLWRVTDTCVYRQMGAPS